MTSWDLCFRKTASALGMKDTWEIPEMLGTRI